MVVSRSTAQELRVEVDCSRFESLPEYRADEMIPLPLERIVEECGGEVARVFEAHSVDIRGVPREIAARDGFIPDTVLVARRRGWAVCRRRERYLLLAVPSRLPDY